MRRGIIAVTGLLAGLAAAAASDANAPAPQGPHVADSINQFAIHFYTQVRGQEGNLFFSPASISTALAMVYSGAGGQTAQQIAQVLHFDGPPPKVNAEFAALLARWNSAAGAHHYQLSVANALWGRQGYPFAAPFQQSLQANYGAAMHVVDFRQSEAARQTINRWVESQTQDKIKDLLPAGSVGPATRLVLANAIYFKAPWDLQFSPSATRLQPFHLADSKSESVPMMHQVASFPYLKATGFSALQMTYADASFSMIVLLPDRADGLAALEESLTSEKLDQWTQELAKSRRMVRVSFPKFTVTQAIDLTSDLKVMGMPLAFSRSADFSPMNDGKEPLWIDRAIHKAFVDVNEQGTEAAAATAITMRAAAALPQNVAEFTADHPFLFVIRDSQSGSILFMGRVVNPSA